MTNALIHTERNQNSIFSNETLAHYVIQKAVDKGVKDFILCPGTRNSPIVSALKEYPDIQKYYWFEERSAAFFALGRARRERQPVAVVVTSGSAAGELLPAAMEAYYTQIPILLITADRPRRFRGTGAPQSVEQVRLFGVYAPFAEDIVEGEESRLEQWDMCAPAQLNVCFEDPIRPREKEQEYCSNSSYVFNEIESIHYLDQFFSEVSCPLAIVGSLPDHAKHQITEFLLRMKIPVILEASSGLRNQASLSHLRVIHRDNIWAYANESKYPIDGILRIGGVPTVSLWRDVENLSEKVKVCSISNLPYSGLSCAGICYVSYESFFASYQPRRRYAWRDSKSWLAAEVQYQDHLDELFAAEPFAEPSLVHALSKLIPENAHVFLGNSLPIREWDLAAVSNRHFHVTSSRGVNGIDGQISTFLGLCQPDRENWALLGDLTTLYDMAGPWIIPQLNNMQINIVVINNSGGKIFSKFFADKIFLHPHELGFKPLAEMWGLDYELWKQVPSQNSKSIKRLIEIVPDLEASNRFFNICSV